MKVKRKTIVSCVILSALVLMQCLPVYASEVFSTGDEFTQLFHTRGFMGNAEVLTKLSFVASLVSNVISICGFIGVSLTVIRLMISLLYKSNPVLFDEIDEIKKNNTWSGGEGAKGMAGGALKFMFGGSLNGIKEKSGGGVIDTIIWFVLGAMPNVKHYSDFADDNGDEKLKDMSTTQYLLKISPKIIMQVFFFSIAWNGVLFQAYGSVVDAMGVAAQRVVNDDLSVAVENVLATGKKYSFAFDKTGDAFGKFKQNVAESMYAEACKKMSKSTRTQQNYYDVGCAIDAIVAKLDMDQVIQVGSASSGKLNFNKNTDVQYVDSDGKEAKSAWNGCSSKKPKSFKKQGESIGEVTVGKSTYVVYKYLDESEKLVGYGGINKSNNKDKIYIEDAGEDEGGQVVASDAVFDNIMVSPYTSGNAPVKASDAWQLDNTGSQSSLQYVVDLTSIGGGSGVSWVTTSQSTPRLYLVCRLNYHHSNTNSTFNIVTRDTSIRDGSDAAETPADNPFGR